MKGNEIQLYRFMEGSEKRFIIPVYQRNYDWKIENCRQLFDDLLMMKETNSKSHFFGSMVSALAEDMGSQDLIIIDGQQRLTTISLLLLAIYDLINEGLIESSDSNLKQRIREEYLINKYSPSDKKIKLKPVKNDADAFNNLVDNNNPIDSSNITTNYKYFYKRILDEEVSVDELFDSFKKLIIIDIFLSSDDDPQLIFESLNSTGLDLSEGDKIRNFILMDVRPTSLQEEYYEKYRHKIEKYTDFDVSAFVRDYISLKTGSIPNINKTYLEFKKFYNKFYQGKKLDLLEDLLAYAKRYKQLISGQSPFKTIEPVLQRLLNFEAKVTRPFLMEALKQAEEGNLNEEDLYQILILVESYLLRRQISSLPTNSLNKIFANLASEIYRIEDNKDNYLEKFKYILLSKKSNSRFPTDEEFMEALSKKDIYHMKARIKQYIMERYENYGTRESKDVHELVQNGTYTIEHIMPQTLSPERKKSLGENYEEIHETYLHRLCNLTLTAYNSEYKNSSFEKKKTIAHGFIDSGLRMNQRLSHYEKFTEEELIARNEEMVGKALEIWPMLESSYIGVVGKHTEIFLNDEDDLRGRKITAYNFLGSTYPVTTWIEMYKEIIKAIYESDSKPLKDKINSENNEYRYFFNNEEVRHSYIKIYDNFYININLNNNTKIHGLRYLFDLYGIDQTELSFVIK
ncbi:DUF262 domain-containing protein [Anaerococcus sp. AGMB09787]|uniref:DUF262 domain-containing protein n=1 Tax=Anaerococcus sp. AGMB09787 TaxID=2922869 RepID=UPI001FAED0D1|nr:DUF262 domain-containing protein [Anaerococcus sp. AGMB09787]